MAIGAGSSSCLLDAQRLEAGDHVEQFLVDATLALSDREEGIVGSGFGMVDAARIVLVEPVGAKDRRATPGNQEELKHAAIGREPSRTNHHRG